MGLCLTEVPFPGPAPCEDTAGASGVAGQVRGPLSGEVSFFLCSFSLLCPSFLPGGGVSWGRVRQRDDNRTFHLPPPVMGALKPLWEVSQLGSCASIIDGGWGVLLCIPDAVMGGQRGREGRSESFGVLSTCL